MSREFGRYESGYFHTQIQYAAEDALAQDTTAITKLWGYVLQDFGPVAYAIASAEAGDAYEADTIFESIKAIQRIRLRLADIERYLEPFKRVADKAIQEKLSTERPQSVETQTGGVVAK